MAHPHASWDDGDGHRVQSRERRPDGTARKPIRIRKGFVAQEEIKRYKPPARRRAEEELQVRQLHPVPAAAAAPMPVAALPPPTARTKTQLKNQKRRAAKKNGKSAGDVEVAALTSAMGELAISDEAELQRTIRRVEKKLRQIEALETRAKEGLALDADQKEKVGKKADLVAQLSSAKEEQCIHARGT